jgi:Protein of unknown function (DUF2934)
MSKHLSRRKYPEQIRPDAPHLPLPTEDIERLAYEYWLERGRPVGSPEEDWFRAEEEVKRRRERPEQKSTERRAGASE